MPPFAVKTHQPTVIERRSRDGQHYGPAQSRQEVPQHPGAEQNQQPDEDVARSLLRNRCGGLGHPPSIRLSGDGTLAVQVGHLGRRVPVARRGAHRSRLLDARQILVGQSHLQRPQSLGQLRTPA